MSAATGPNKSIFSDLKRNMPLQIKNQLKGLWIHIILPMVFVLFMLLFHPFRETFQQDTDEGINLIKAVLVMEGHQITGDIASDQPPLLSNLLAMVFEQAGVSVNIGRFVILLFSALLLGAAGMAAEIAWGRTTSLLVYLIMILLPNYLLASVSVMIGQPSIALAMVAMLCVFLWHRHRNWPWLLLSGIFMSLSIFMKIFTVILIPIFGIGLLVGQWVFLRGTAKGGSYWIQLLKPAFVFSLSLVVISAALALVMVDHDGSGFYYTSEVHDHVGHGTKIL